MAALADALSGAREGGHPALLIGGEAGAGKSRLVAEFTATVPGARVLTGGCLQLGGEELPFTPFATVLRGLVRELGADAVTAMVPGRGIPELARLIPELGEPDEGRDPGEARARLFEEMLTLLGRLAESGPVIVLVEDAHWADESTRRLLAFLIEQQRELPGTLIAVTFRSDELHRTHPLRPMLAELARIGWVRRMELPRLTRRETAELASQILGREPDPDLVARLYARSEGNPLFAEELIGCADLDRDLPESLRDLLLGTTARLPDATREVLRMASSGIEPYGHGLLAAVSGLDEEALTAALRPAVTANVLLASADGYSFRHALIREAVNGDLLPGEDERQHARYATIIDADPSLAGPGRAAIEAAHHWYWARDTGRALSGAWQVASLMTQSVAHAERLALLSRVLRLWDQVPDAAERTGTDRAGVLEQAMLTAELTGDDHRGLAFADAALAELDPVTAPVRVAFMLGKRNVFKRLLGRPGGGDDLRAALALVPAEATAAAATRAEILLAMGYFGVTPTQRAYAEEALALARRSGAVGTEVNALLTLALGATAPAFQAAPGSEALALIAQARATAARSGHFQTALRAASLESYLLAAAGEYERTAEVARQGMREAEENGLTRAFGTFLAINVAEPLFALGRWDESLEMAERALELSPPTLHRAALWGRQAYVTVARGQVEAASEALSAAHQVLSDARFEYQYHLPQAELTVQLRMVADGPAAALDEAIAVTERYDLSSAIPVNGWPLVIALAHVSLAALRQARRPGGEHGRAGRHADGTAADRGGGAAGGGALAAGVPAELRGTGHDRIVRPCRDRARRRGRRALRGPGRLGRGSQGLGSAPPALRVGHRAHLRGRSGAGRLGGADRPGPGGGGRAAAAGRAAGGSTRRAAAGRRDHLARAAGGRDAGRQDAGRARPARADRSRVGGAAPGRRRADQPRHRRGPVHLSQDRQCPRVEHHGQTRRRQPGSGRGDSTGSRALRSVIRRQVPRFVR